MAASSKPTPGPVMVHEGGRGYGYVRDAQYRPICAYGTARMDVEESAANADLIAEAINVHHETGLTPRELQKQRDELLAALKEARDALNGAPNTVGLHHQIDAAIASVEGGAA